MADQLLATFYVESPNEPYTDLTVTARIQYQSGTNWYNEDSEEPSLRCDIANAHYEDANGLRRRYKINVHRQETYSWYDGKNVFYYRLHKAGIYKRRLQILANNAVMLERMLYLTVQPTIHVYVEDGEQKIDLVRTEETVVSQNPLVKTMSVIMNTATEAVAVKNILLTQPNSYKGKIFVNSNVPVDLVSNDLTEENTDEYSRKWMQLKDQIIVTRKIKSTNYQWGGEY